MRPTVWCITNGALDQQLQKCHSVQPSSDDESSSSSRCASKEVRKAYMHMCVPVLLLSRIPAASVIPSVLSGTVPNMLI